MARVAEAWDRSTSAVGDVAEYTREAQATSSIQRLRLAAESARG